MIFYLIHDLSIFIINCYMDYNSCTSEVEAAIRLLEKVNVTAVNAMFDDIKQKFTPEQILLLKYKL